MKDIEKIEALEVRIIKLEGQIGKVKSDTILETFIFLNELQKFYETDEKSKLVEEIKHKKDIVFRMLDNVQNTKEDIKDV